MLSSTDNNFDFFLFDLIRFRIESVTFSFFLLTLYENTSKITFIIHCQRPVRCLFLYLQPYFHYKKLTN